MHVGGFNTIPEFAPTEHSFAVFLHSFVASLFHVAHQLSGYKVSKHF